MTLLTDSDVKPKSEQGQAVDAEAAAVIKTTPQSLNGDEILARFDSFVKERKLYFDVDYQTETREIRGWTFEFRISQAMGLKPYGPKDGLATHLFQGEGPRPGSDINVGGLQVAILNDTHDLCFNGFSSYRPHFLLLTLDGYRRQKEALDIDDFRAIQGFLSQPAFSDYLIFYNCGTPSGNSREHKHLQAIPKQSLGGNPWLNIDKKEEGIVPFALFQDTQSGIDAKTCFAAYRTGLAAVERTLDQVITPDNFAPSHNLIMDKDRLIVVPRRVAGIGGLAANAGGLLGMIWVNSREMMQKWIDTDPVKLLEAGGAPKLL